MEGAAERLGSLSRGGFDETDTDDLIVGQHPLTMPFVSQRNGIPARRAPRPPRPRNTGHVLI